MEAAQAAVRVAPYQARPGRRVLVALSLDDLRGPATGMVELPLRLFWSAADHTFDLSRPAVLRSVYETVLREAGRPEDLTAFHLPRGVRQAWEDEHPALRAARAASAPAA
jgi:hypothetical protein